MIFKKKILAIVPARGGSKGLKFKNLRKVKNKSLVEITGKFIKKCKFIDHAIISTDNDKIAIEGKKSGLYFIRRPKNISGDKVADVKVLLHAYRELIKKKKFFDLIVMLHPTSPLREINDLKNAIKFLLKNKFDSVWTISPTETKYHPDKQLLLDGKRIKFFTIKGKSIIARQQLSKVYHRNSNAYIVDAKFLLKKKSIISKKTGGYIVKSKQISIDTEDDIQMVEKIFKN
jgi:CMP-N-acetylneuraminic acid synthetase